MSADLSLPRLQSLLAPSLRHRMALALMFASGFAGLGYQVIWTQQCALWLGHEAAAVLAVVTAFFGGLALGSLALGPRVERSARPELWYSVCETVIALWCLALAGLLSPTSRWMLELTGAQPTVAWQGFIAFVGTFALLLPATLAMGATLPAMLRITSRWGREGQGVGALYACNTAGAFVGVLLVAFWLVPSIGLARTAALCAVLNLTCALVVLVLPSAAIASPVSRPLSLAPPGRGLALLWPLAATGALGIGYEVLVVRVLSQVTEDTVYTFALLLAVYLVGTALGAAAWTRWSRPQDPGRIGAGLVSVQAAACLLGTIALWGADPVRQSVVGALGGGMAAALAAEAALALIAFGLPTLVMGALFTHLVTRAHAAGHSFGRALGINTLGAALAPLVFGVVLAPALGPKLTLLAIVGGYLALALLRMPTAPMAWFSGLVVVALAIWAPPLAFVAVPVGGRIVSYRDGALAAVSVVEDGTGVARLRINNRQQEGSNATLLADARQALLPLLLHPSPQRALFLGLGTGLTASSATLDPGLQIEAVELLPEVIAASTHFTQALGPSIEPSRLRLMAADARRYVRTSDRRYDLIVADNFHPARSGSGALYTVEHFEAVRARLTEQGVFCQWLPLHQLDLDTVRSIVASFLTVNPGAWAMLSTNSLDTPVLGLVARRDAGPLDLRALRQRLLAPEWSRPLADFGIADEFALLGGFIAGPRALTRFAGDAPLNTDDRPLVAYRAPRITYAPDSQPRERLLALLGRVALDPAELVDCGADPAWAPRLAAYWRARDRFIELGQHVQASGDVHRMLAQVREPLLSVLRTSPDFRPAYDPLLRMAGALGRNDPQAAHALLAELQRVQPARPEAGQAMRRLATPSP